MVGFQGKSDLNWTCGILSMGAAGPRGKSLVLASWPWGAPPHPPPSPSRDSSLTDLLLLSRPGPSMVAMGVICSWSGEREETSMGLCTIESIGL